MSGKYHQLRLEMRANFELTWGGQADANRRIDQIASRLEIQGRDIAEQGRQIAEQGRQIAKQGQQIEAALKDTARIAREVVAIGDQNVGRLRQMDQRFGQFLDVLESEAQEQSEAISDLQERVSRLERRGPAA